MVPPPLAALLELALELVLPPDPPELELELLLEPHAATTSEAATASATALIRRFLKVISLVGVVGVSATAGRRVLTSCEPVIHLLRALGRQPVPEAEMRVNEAP